jgi:hypothetical protein
MSEMEILATLATSETGLVLSKTLMFSSFHVAFMEHLLSQTCWMEGGKKPYTFHMRLRIVKVEAMLPNISVRYELMYSILPSVAPTP